MNKSGKTVISLAAVIALGLLLPSLTAFIVYGFSINNVVLSNYIFVVGLLTAAVGGIWMVVPFFFIKAKLRKNPTAEKIEIKKREGLLWEYVLFSGGVVIVVISYLIAVL
jgi:hypothetical protein